MWVPIEEAAAERGLSGGDLAAALQYRVVVRKTRGVSGRIKAGSRVRGAVRTLEDGQPWWAVKRIGGIGLSSESVVFVSHLWGPDVEPALAEEAARTLRDLSVLRRMEW